MKKRFLVLVLSTSLIFAVVEFCKISLKNAYDEGAFFSYAEGYLKHKHHPEGNEYFLYDETLLEYVSASTNVYIAQDKVYHRKGCAPHAAIARLKDILNEYSPCASCKPPIVMQ